jgi:hypothetical protein
MVYTPMMYAKGMNEESREARKNRNLLKTEGNGWDVGAAVRFLVGGEARWMTGVILPIGAGATAAIGTELPKNASTNSQDMHISKGLPLQLSRRRVLFRASFS